MKEHKNQDTITTLIEWEIINQKGIVCHKSACDEGEVIMMCERDEECFSSMIAT
jgi:hypothetical protein